MALLNPLSNQRSVNVLPANKSIVIADSKYRLRNTILQEDGTSLQIETNDASPYNFEAKLSAGIVGKLIIYQKLYWSQPIYSHSNANCELRFQINGDETKTYVVYATPFLMFTQYDGNAPGIAWGTPQPYSYADNMEKALNYDVRLLQSNLQLTIPINPLDRYGRLYDANGNVMTVYFRYSPSQGFSISFGPSTNPIIPVYTIKLLPCSYIEKAHFVHGFGILDPSVSSNSFVPRNSWTCAYFSDDTPNLLPFRYVSIRSNELVKDRRMISFQSANSGKVLNEIAIIALSPIYTGTYNTQVIGDDATVISKRDDYQPQSFHIKIVDEEGKFLIADSPLSNLMQTPYIVNETTKYSFFNGASINRGNPIFMNALLFGVQNNFFLLFDRGGKFLFVIIQSTLAPPLGVTGYIGVGYLSPPTVAINDFSSSNFFTMWNRPDGYSPHLFRQTVPVISTPNGSKNVFSSYPDSYTYAGFGEEVLAQNPFIIQGQSSTAAIPPEVSVFIWDPEKNPNPYISLDAKISASSIDAGGNSIYFSTCYCWLIGWSYELQDIILASQNIPGISFNPGLTSKNLQTGIDILMMTMNPKYAGLTSVQHVAFYFYITSNYAGGDPPPVNTIGLFHWKVDFSHVIFPNVPLLRFWNPNTVAVQTKYIPPATNESNDENYNFGNPQSNAKAEELIHEIAIILDKN
jgi:hypothetical protein